jgi:hypothetical protein
VRRVERRAPRERHDLIVGCRRLLRVLESRRVSPRTLGERLPQQRLHLVALRRRRRTIGKPHRREPQLAVRNEGGDVDRRPRRLERVQVLPCRPPRRREVVAVPVDRAPRELRVANREAPEAAVADDLGRHTLVDRADGARVDEERVVGVAVDVHEARRHGEPGGVELRRVGSVNGADARDPPFGDRDVGADAGGARAVVDDAVADHQVDGHARTVSTVAYGPSRCHRSCATPTASSSSSNP